MQNQENSFFDCSKKLKMKLDSFKYGKNMNLPARSYRNGQANFGIWNFCMLSRLKLLKSGIQNNRICKFGCKTCFKQRFLACKYEKTAVLHEPANMKSLQSRKEMQNIHILDLLAAVSAVIACNRVLAVVGRVSQKSGMSFIFL